MFDAKLINVTNVVYELPVGRGRHFGKSMNPVLDDIVGGWQLNAINTANTGLPVNVVYNPLPVNDVTGLIQASDFRVASLRPNVSGSAASQSTAQSLLTYFSGYTFTTPLPRSAT